MIGFPPRPKLDDERVFVHALGRILPKIESWLQVNRMRIDTLDIINLLSEAKAPDAFEFAENLKSKGWPANAALVSVLNEIDLHRSHGDMISAWITWNNIRVPYRPGDVVSTSTRKRAVVVSVADFCACIEIGTYAPLGGLYTNVEDIPFEDATPFRPANSEKEQA